MYNNIIIILLLLYRRSIIFGVFVTRAPRNNSKYIYDGSDDGDVTPSRPAEFRDAVADRTSGPREKARPRTAPRERERESEREAAVRSVVVAKVEKKIRSGLHSYNNYVYWVR